MRFINNRSFLKHKFNKLCFAGTVSMFVTVILPMTDAIISGQVLGENAVSAVNIVSPAFSIASFLGGIVSFGVPVLYARAIGAFEQDNADKVYSLGVISSILLGILYFVCLIFFGDLYLGSFGVSDAVRNLAIPYFFWYKMNILITPFFLLLNEIIMIDGNERLCILSCLVQLCSNVVASVLFSVHFGMAGIGFASFLGTLLATIALIIHYFSKKCTLHFVWYFSILKLKEIISFSVVDSLTYIYSAVFILIMNHFIIAEFGEKYLPVVSVFIFICDIIILFDGIGVAICTLTPIYSSENNVNGIFLLMKYATKMTLFLGIIATIVIEMTAPLIPAMFDFESRKLIDASIQIARNEAIFLVFNAFNYEFSSYYNVEEHFGVAAIMCAFRDLVFPLAIGMLLGMSGNIIAVSWGIGIAAVFALIVPLVYVYLRNRDKKYPLLFLDDSQEKKYFIYEFIIGEKAIIEVLDEVSDFLQKHSVSGYLKNKIMLIIEESYMLTYEKNGKKGILAECNLILGNRIQLILRDDGIIYSFLDEESDLDSFRKYFMDCLVKDFPNKRYIVSNGYNRYCFELVENFKKITSNCGTIEIR